jgi:hypothetical protein
MFYVKTLLANPALMTKIEECVSQLYQIGAISALMEIRGERNKPQPTAHPLELNAARAAWADGYLECIQDLCQFRERFTQSEQTPVRLATYGAGERSLALGDIDPDEYRKLYGRPAPDGIAPKQPTFPRKSA